MAIFSYISQTVDGREVKGRLEASDMRALAAQLHQKGLFLVSCEPAAGDVPPPPAASIAAPPAPRRAASAAPQARASSTAAAKRAEPTTLKKDKVSVSHTELLLATRQLEISLNSGIPLLDTLEFIAQEAESARVKSLFSNLADLVRAGNSFTYALRYCSDSFSSIYINLTRAGEKSGTLAESLGKVADYLEKQDDFRRKIRTYMIYPCIIFIVAMLTLFFMTVFILPIFVGALNLPLVQLPVLTRMLIRFSYFVQNYWPGIAAGGALIAWLAKRQLATLGKNPTLDAAALGFPLIGGVVAKISISRFTATLSTLLDSGVPVLEALEICRDVTGNSVIGAEVDKVYDHVRAGHGLADKIKQSPYFPKLVGNMMATGEKSGQLPNTMVRVSQYYDKEVDSALRDFFVSLEPLLILLMGVVVGLIAVGMLMPLFQLTDFVS